MAERSETPALRRIRKEIEDIRKEKDRSLKEDTVDKTMKFFTLFRKKGSTMFDWEALLTAPEKSYYEGGSFLLKITFPTEYPFKPPRITFVTRIYHPNINSKGAICLDILQESWSPALTIQKVLISLLSWLDDPNPDDPLVPEIARIYKDKKDVYRKNCQEYVKKYCAGVTKHDDLHEEYI